MEWIAGKGSRAYAAWRCSCSIHIRGVCLLVMHAVLCTTEADSYEFLLALGMGERVLEVAGDTLLSPNGSERFRCGLERCVLLPSGAG
jgi:hypothetical protein